MNAPHPGLRVITEQLADHRADAMLVQQSLLARREIMRWTTTYRQAGWLIGQWSQDSILAACRRLLDNTGGNSLWRTLKQLGRMASQVTPKLVAAHWVASGRTFVESTPEAVARDVLDALNEKPGLEALRTKRVQREMADLRAAYEDVIAAANKSVAHDDNAFAFAMPAARLDALAQDVINSAQRWARLVDGIETRLISGPTVEGLTPLSHAIRLFDWEEYIKARSAARAEAGMSAEAADTAARVRFEFHPWDGETSRYRLPLNTSIPSPSDGLAPILRIAGARCRNASMAAGCPRAQSG